MDWTPNDAAHLAAKLIAARQKRGWGIYDADKKMGGRGGGVNSATLKYLEGGRPDRPTPRGFAVQLHTAVHICSAYYPDVQLQDFFGSSAKSLLKFVPVDRHRRKIRKLQAEPPRDRRFNPSREY